MGDPLRCACFDRSNALREEQSERIPLFGLYLSLRQPINYASAFMDKRSFIEKEAARV